MNKSLMITVALTVAVGMTLSALPTNSQEREPWTNERVQNIQYEHPPFEILNDESQGKRMVVSLADGSIYHQSYMNPHMDKIQWDDALWYVCDGNIIWAESDAHALSLCPPQ